MKILALVTILAAFGAVGLGGLRYFETLDRAGDSAALEAPAGDGRISGRVQITKSSSSSSRSAKGLYGKSTSRLSKSAASDKRAIVYLSNVPGRYQPPQSRPAMRQKNISIVPHVLPVLVGTTVDFPNDDEIYHNIFSLSSVKSFDLGRYAKGVSKSVTFSKTGEVKVFCDIHSQMSAFVLVLQNPYYAICAADGEYAIEGIPAGTYDVVVWHESGGRQSRRVSVSAAQAQKMDFTL